MFRRLVAVGLFAFGGTGCALVRDSASLAAFKMKEAVQDCREAARNRKWADQAWDNVSHANPDAGFSADHAAGFKDGFSHYLYRGGNGEPPPLPPRHYRTIAYQTPQGYRAIEDWFEGYRHGAATARESGYRQFVTGPSSLRGSVAAGPLPSEVGIEAAPSLVPIDLPMPEPLPAPRPTAPLAGPRVHARILGIRSLGPVMQPES